MGGGKRKLIFKKSIEIKIKYGKDLPKNENSC